MTNILYNIVFQGSQDGVGIEAGDPGTVVIRNNTIYNVDATMDGVREYRGGSLVVLAVRNGRRIISVENVEVDLLDLVDWLRQHRPEMLECFK